jgi:Uma2 family endonuclease
MAAMSGIAPPDKPRPKTRWTYEEYYQIAETGLFRDRHVELINGEIIEMPPQSEAHFITIMIAAKSLEKVFGEGYSVRTQGPLRTGVDEEPEPDISVVIGDFRETLAAGRPRSAVLVVEVAISTREFDLGEKAEIYAGAGIEDYWVIEVEARRLHAHRRTIPDTTLVRGRRYSQIEVLSESATIAPLAMPNRPIRLSDLLP